jgi:hypothetical protein
MFAFQLKQFLPIFFLLSLAAAGKFKFSIQEILVGETREGLGDDDLLLAIASTAGSSNNSNHWMVGSVNNKDQIKWDNLTQEVEVSDKASNLSIAFGLSNTPDLDEQAISSGLAMVLESFALNEHQISPRTS